MRRFVFILAIVAIVIMAGCTGSQTLQNSQELYPHHHNSFNRIALSTTGSLVFDETTLAGLEYRATNIVRGRMGNDARIVFQTSDFRGGRNAVSFEVYEVFKGNLEVGQIIRIMEPYFIKDGTLFTSSNYMPSTPYQEYFFFLGEQRPDNRPGEFAGSFFTLHGERSRFPVPLNNGASIQAFNESELPLGDYANIEVYMKIWQEVIAAYMN